MLVTVTDVTSECLFVQNKLSSGRVFFTNSQYLFTMLILKRFQTLLKKVKAVVTMNKYLAAARYHISDFRFHAENKLLHALTKREKKLAYSAAFHVGDVVN